MARTSRLAQKQLRALDRIRALPGIEAFHLAGATAIAWHLGHRRSVDLDLFSESADVDLDRIRLAASRHASFEVVASGDAVLELEVSDVPVDLVAYPYELLEPPVVGPSGMPTAGLRDLAAMKLSAISRRGIRRDFWDLFAIVSSGLSLAEAGDAYWARFGRSGADLYHVERALTWFEDAERDVVWPAGLTPRRWNEIKRFFRKKAPELLLDEAD